MPRSATQCNPKECIRTSVSSQVDAGHTGTCAGNVMSCTCGIASVDGLCGTYPPIERCGVHATRCLVTPLASSGAADGVKVENKT